MARPDPWDRFRDEARRRLTVHFSQCECTPGTFRAEATVPSFSAPVGTVWYTWVGNHTLEIGHSFVWEKLRRCGIRTTIHRQMLEWYAPTLRRVITGAGSAEGSRWLRATGFRRDGKDFVLDVRTR
jgi:hypothetical protein